MIRNSKFAVALAALTIASAAGAAVITFDGGTAYFNGGGSVVTNNSTSWANVDYYEEDGFRLDFVGGAGAPFSGHVGDYYGAGNAVIHAHWLAGGLGTVTAIMVTKIGGGTFDLNYFILTSNTSSGGGPASGSELAFIKNNSGNDIQLPSEDWGFPATQIFLPATYDGITSFDFYVRNDVDCFGMDEFYIDEPPPPSVPDTGATLPLLGLGLAALAGFKAKGRSKSVA